MRVNVFIGYDENESIAYDVLCYSIIRRSSIPVSFTPIKLSNLPFFKRERGKLDSTDFSISRFLTPYLSNYEGWSIYLDCDMLMLTDIRDLWDMRNDKYSVMCTKHNYNPKNKTKFCNNIQTSYEKKNWSSLMMFNNQKCRKLGLDYVESSNGLKLHQFDWVDDDLIGNIPLCWNYLVGERNQPKDIKMIHYTNGGPWFEKETDYYDELWKDEFNSMTRFRF